LVSSPLTPDSTGSLLSVAPLSAAIKISLPGALSYQEKYTLLVWLLVWGYINKYGRKYGRKYGFHGFYYYKTNSSTALICHSEARWNYHSDISFEVDTIRIPGQFAEKDQKEFPMRLANQK
jgi:hypothetical protein